MVAKRNAKRNVSVQLIRVIAMFMIIFDHLLAMIEFPMKSVALQIFNSGVLIFLLISGLLYGNKTVKNWKQWFMNRFFRICIPLWIFMIIDFIVEACIWNYFDIKLVFVYMFNLQGILGVSIAGKSLWFLTLIMICYTITPLLQWIKQKKCNMKLGIASIIIGIILQIFLAYTTDVGLVDGHTLSWCVIAVGMYVVGYFAGNLILNDNIGKNKIVVITALTVVASAIALLFKMRFDGKIIYDRIVIYYAMVVIDLWICIVLYKLGRYLCDGVIYKIINHLDAVSYEFYIVHGLIISAVTVNILQKYGVVCYVLSTLVLSWVAALILHWVCGLIYKIQK